MERLSPALAPVWRAVHARLSTGLPVSRIKLDGLDDEQQSAIADLLGSARLPGTSVTVSLARLDEALTEAIGKSTREIVAELVGPIGDRAADRQRATQQRAALRDWLVNHPVVQAEPALAQWARTIRASRDELDKTLAVLARLPADGVPLPVYADAVLGDTHALDEGTRCGHLVMKALAAMYGIEDRRALWERVGVADDQLSSTVLIAGFRSAGDTPADQILRVTARAGHAAVLTLQQVRAGVSDPGPDVWVVENPSVLAMALARFTNRCPPMVCTSGWPSAAAMALLRRLTARLHYHGDFDGDGLRIAAYVVARTGALPWRMTSADYLAGVSDGPPVGRVTPVPWDPDLAGHLVRHGRTLAEERVAPKLLDELGY
ncbi:TIGR02679 family protein [Kibdelosporangium philippinense]|uniref:TIGR02679 family protein n=1 Tax=Kibdelosporangium philippinense TaxID=211113 RepID=A0ABS8Z935_9PSEU|nr:TIGR02679 family protein [Kibdelosporangium philippinense]MCE7003922.1 TIGR02679 family protein [Kibdelosporangium philippinense]